MNSYKKLNGLNTNNNHYLYFVIKEEFLKGLKNNLLYICIKWLR